MITLLFEFGAYMLVMTGMLWIIEDSFWSALTMALGGYVVTGFALLAYDHAILRRPFGIRTFTIPMIWVSYFIRGYFSRSWREWNDDKT